MPTNHFFGLLLLLIILEACNNNPSLEGMRINPDTTCCYSLKTDLSDTPVFSVEPFQRFAFSDSIHFNGIVEADPNYQRSVSVPMKGFLKSVFIHPGKSVTKGELLAVLEHPDYSKLQLELLETKSRYDYLKQDYARQGELGLEHATSLKNVQKAQSDFISIESKLYSLKIQLTFIGINPDSVHLNNIASTIRIYSPVAGTVSFKNLIIGQLYTEDNPLFLITDYSTLLISFSIPQEALTRIAENSLLRFNPVLKTGNKYTAMISSASPISEGDGFFTLYAEFKNNDRRLSPGMKVESFLPYIDSVYAIPVGALKHFVDGDYIYFEKGKGCFKSCRINPGRIQGTLVEIKNAPPAVMAGRIVVSGAENLNSCKEHH